MEYQDNTQNVENSPKNKVTFSLSKETYFAKTPAFLTKLGDTLLGVSTTITTYEIAQGNKEIAITALVIGALGKFLSGFFKENIQA